MGNEVIARIWHGEVPRDKANAYEDFLIKRAVPDYESVEGNLGVEILTRYEDNVAHFLVISYWKDLESIKRFAGEDYERAKYYEEDKDFLLKFEEKVQHYKVVWSSKKF